MTNTITSHRAEDTAALPRWLWLTLPLAWLPVQFALAPLAPSFYVPVFVGEFGVVELATAILLLPAAALALLAARRLLRDRNAVPGVLLCVFALGCVFLAGEEVSWGQHVFGWGSPDYFLDNNVQDETNLHNLGYVNKSVPKWLVVIGMAAGGIVLPLMRRRGALPAFFARRWVAPLLPISACLPVAAVTLIAHLLAKVVAKAMGFRFEDRFGVDVPENVEMFISVFCLIYAYGAWVRAARSPDARVTV